MLQKAELSGLSEMSQVVVQLGHKVKSMVHLCRQIQRFALHMSKSDFDKRFAFRRCAIRAVVFSMVIQLTRFERTRILSARALQITMGAPILIKTSATDPKEVARQEFEADVLPIIVKRPF